MLLPPHDEFGNLCSACEKRRAPGIGIALRVGFTIAGSETVRLLLLKVALIPLVTSESFRGLDEVGNQPSHHLNINLPLRSGDALQRFCESAIGRVRSYFLTTPTRNL